SIKTWRVVNYVIRLPLARLATGIDQWRVLFVNGAGLAMVIGFVVVGIEHLNFIPAGEINTAISAPLPVAFDDSRRGPLDVELPVAQSLPCRDASCALHGCHALLDFPLDGSTILFALPLR